MIVETIGGDLEASWVQFAESMVFDDSSLLVGNQKQCFSAIKTVFDDKALILRLKGKKTFRQLMIKVGNQ